MSATALPTRVRPATPAKARRSFVLMPSPAAPSRWAALMLVSVMIVPSDCWVEGKPLAAGAGERRDRLEGAVRLDHGQEDLVQPPIVVRPIGEPRAAEVEGAGLHDGVEERLAGGFAVDPLERRGDETADHV